MIHPRDRPRQPGSVARHGRVDEQRPCVDAALQVVEIPESCLPEVLGGVLAADAVVALEDQGRLPIPEEQRIMVGPIEQSRAGDPGYRALLLGTHVDQLDGGAAFEQRLQIGRRQLTDWSRRLTHVPAFSSAGSGVVKSAAQPKRPGLGNRLM